VHGRKSPRADSEGKTIMDSNATLDLLISALRSANYQRAAEHARNLQDWVARGGFEPSNPNWRACVREALH
jgi:hypothetical protein